MTKKKYADISSVGARSSRCRSNKGLNSICAGVLARQYRFGLAKSRTGRASGSPISVHPPELARRTQGLDGLQEGGRSCTRSRVVRLDGMGKRAELAPFLVRGEFWHTLEDGRVQCVLCPRH